MPSRFARIRDAWEVLRGRKVAREVVTIGVVNITVSPNQAPGQIARDVFDELQRAKRARQPPTQPS